MTPYDDYEIRPRTRTEQPDKPGHFSIEVRQPHEADVWTLYGHLPEGGVEAIGDFATRDRAEEAFERSTGIPFGGTRAVAERLRVMRAGPTLLDALRTPVAATGCYASHSHEYKPAQAVIAGANGRPS